MFLTGICVALASVIGFGGGDESYEFRSSPAYHALKPAEQQALEQVHRDFVLLWGALDLYLREHENLAPEKLESLVPQYLKELPPDPFATKETAEGKDLGRYVSSRDGWGYRYRRGQGDSFIIASVGLPDFPYLAKSGNVGLYMPRGTWISGRQPTLR
jgi:hypothetical protein